jgi:hypothetical protein
MCNAGALVERAYGSSWEGREGGREGGSPGNRLMGGVFHEPNENSKVTICLILMCSCSTNVVLSSKRMTFSALLNNVATTT